MQEDVGSICAAATFHREGRRPGTCPVDAGQCPALCRCLVASRVLLNQTHPQSSFNSIYEVEIQAKIPSH